MKKRLISLISIGLILVGAVVPSKKAQAVYWPGSVDIQSQAAVVMEVETGTVLYEKNADESYYPASITKIMTAMVAMENSKLDEVVTFSEKAVYENEGDTSHIARDVGEEMTMEQCLYGMLLESANECAWAIGEHVSGDMDSFVKLMNDRAKELGCKNTHFNNPNGLPDRNHYVSAMDYALISREAFKNPKLAEIVGTKSYTIPPTNKHKNQETLLNNHHAMLNYYKTSQYLYDYCLGGKTGYTSEANNTLVTYARKDGMTLVCVVLNAPAAAHYLDTRALFDYCFDNFSIYTVSDYENIENVNETNLAGSLRDNENLIRISKTGAVILPKTGRFTDAEPAVVPVKTKDKEVVGQIIYKYGGRYVGCADLIYESDPSGGYPFDNISPELGGSGIKYFRIDFKMILSILLIIALIAAIVYYIDYRSSDILLFKHRYIDSRIKARSKYKVIQSKNKRRKRRR